MEQLTSTVKQNTGNPNQANRLVVSASSLALKGNAAVGDVVDSMDPIKKNSNKILDIIAVIDSMAFQNNVLALNAATEAARCEQGCSFTVMADEVCNPVQRSSGQGNQRFDC